MKAQLKSLKLNSLCKQALADREMNFITGGEERPCGCSCQYEGQPGGSSTAANKAANSASGAHSTNQYWETGGGSGVQGETQTLTGRWVTMVP